MSQPRQSFHSFVVFLFPRSVASMFVHLFSLAAALCLGLAKADNPSMLNVSSEVAAQHSCDAACQAILAQANAADLSTFSIPFDYDFYSTANNFTGSKPGDILKLQLMDTSLLTVVPGTVVYRMQYTSKDIDGSLIPATAIIAFPFAKTAKKFNLVAFAHGTTGGSQGCAPSLQPGLNGQEGWLYPSLQGYAVVQTDYAGLGNNHTQHKYISNLAQAKDVFYSAVAAKKAFPNNISNNWVALGHSQGGSAVWKLSELKAVQDPSSGYLGGVALSPAAAKAHEFAQLGLKRLKESNSTMENFALLSGLPGIVYAVQAVFPDYDPTWVAKELKQRLELAHIGQYCVTATGSIFMGLTLDQLLTSLDVSGDKTMAKFQKINAPGQGDSASRPLLITHGLADSIIMPESVKSAFQDSRKAGNPVRLTMYPGLGHGGIITGSAPEWQQFIADRFAGAWFDRHRDQSVATPFDLVNAVSPSS